MAEDARWAIWEKLGLARSGKSISYKRYLKELKKYEKGLPPYN
jgi:hypothetical protein